MHAILGDGCTIGSRSEFKVLNTTPLQPASKDLATISALLETGDDESRNGFLNFTPQKSMDKSTWFVKMCPPLSRAWYANLLHLKRWIDYHENDCASRTAQFVFAQLIFVIFLNIP
jgi:hypothetical protein